MNVAMTDYRNEATLLNIVRASRNEPMNFVALTGATGHATLGGTQGLPTVTFGPDIPVITATTKIPRNYAFGPNSINEAASVDFTVSLLDDPGSYAALMTPLDPAMMGFFFGRNWPATLLLPLFVNEIRIIPIRDGKRPAMSYAFFVNQTKDPIYVFCSKNDDQKTFACNPTPMKETDRDYVEKVEACRAGESAVCTTPGLIIFAYLKDRALRFQIPVVSSPLDQPTSARICFDDVYSGYSYNHSFSATMKKTMA
jgi:hypothetical protein